MADENDNKGDDTSPFEGFQSLDHEGTVVPDEATDDNDDGADDADDNEEENQDADDNEGDEDDEDSADEEDAAEDDAEDDDGAVDDDDHADDADGFDDDDPEEGGDSGEDEEGEKPKKKTTVKSRIKQLTARTYSAENRAKAAEKREQETLARLDVLEKKLTPDDDGAKDEDDTTDSGDVTKPDFNDKKYKYGELDPQYIEDVSDWKVDKKFEERDKKRSTEDAKAKSEQQAKQWQKQFETTVSSGQAKYKDFKKVVVDGAEGDNPKYALTQDTVLMALESDVGDDVMYHIANRPKLAARIAQMSVVGQAKEFGRLEARFDKDKTPKKKKKAPGAGPTPKRAKGGTAAKKINAKTDDFAAFEAQVNRDAHKAAKRKQR